MSGYVRTMLLEYYSQKKMSNGDLVNLAVGCERGFANLREVLAEIDTILTLILWD
jgi:hypothetical protein